MNERYGAEYNYYAATGLAPRISSAWWSARFYVRLLGRYIRGGRVLDHGCGMGNVLKVLERRYEPYGLDVSSFGVAAARQNAPRSRVWVGDLASVGAASHERFSAVL